VAIVKPLPGENLTLDELREFGAESLSAYKLPRELILRDIPRNPSGKILKHILRGDLQNAAVYSSSLTPPTGTEPSTTTRPTGIQRACPQAALRCALRGQHRIGGTRQDPAPPAMW
jgi:hypothetical protein